jgi:hypothetical protein
MKENWKHLNYSFRCVKTKSKSSLPNWEVHLKAQTIQEKTTSRQNPFLGIEATFSKSHPSQALSVNRKKSSLECLHLALTPSPQLKETAAVKMMMIRLCLYLQPSSVIQTKPRLPNPVQEVLIQDRANSQKSSWRRTLKSLWKSPRTNQ